MNRRAFNIGAVGAVVTATSGLLIPDWVAAAQVRNGRFYAGMDYWLETMLRINDHQEWDNEPVMQILDGETQLWAWSLHQCNEDDEIYCAIQVASDLPDESDDYSGYNVWPSIRPGPWEKFQWHLKFSPDADGLIEGWQKDRKILELAGPNCEFGTAELTYQEHTSPAIHLSRVNWRAGG